MSQVDAVKHRYSVNDGNPRVVVAVLVQVIEGVPAQLCRANDAVYSERNMVVIGLSHDPNAPGVEPV